MEVDVQIGALKAIVPLDVKSPVDSLAAICVGPELALLREVDGRLDLLRGRDDAVSMSLKRKGALVALVQNLNSRGLVSPVRSDWYHPQEGPVALDMGYLHCRQGGEYGLLDPVLKLQGITDYLEQRAGAVIPGARLIEGSSSHTFLPLTKIEHARGVKGAPFDQHFKLMWNGHQFVECAFTLEHGFLPIRDGRSFQSTELLVDNNIETWDKFYGVKFRVRNGRLELRGWGPCEELSTLDPALEAQVLRFFRKQKERDDLIYPTSEKSDALVAFDASAYAGRVFGAGRITRSRMEPPRDLHQWCSYFTPLNHAIMLNSLANNIQSEEGKSRAIIVGEIIGDSCTFTFPFMRVYQPVDLTAQDTLWRARVPEALTEPADKAAGKILPVAPLQPAAKQQAPSELTQRSGWFTAFWRNILGLRGH